MTRTGLRTERVEKIMKTRKTSQTKKEKRNTDGGTTTQFRWLPQGSVGITERGMCNSKTEARGIGRERRRYERTE